MTLVFTGFDSIDPTADIAAQVPELVMVNDASISVVGGRNNDGQALQTTNGAYLEYGLLGLSHNRTVSMGASFKYTNAASNNILIQVCNAESPLISSNHEAGYSQPPAVLYVKDGFLWVSLSSGLTERLIAFADNERAYIELRFFWEPGNYTGQSSYIYVNGLKVFDLGCLRYIGNTKRTVVYLALAPSNMQIDIDDVYIETYDTKGGVIPVLASGKISSLALTTASNTFSVTGTSADAAISDNSDATYINSIQPAEAVFSVDKNNVPDIYALQLATRAKSSTSGVTTFSLEDSKGVDICPESTVGFTNVLSNYTLPSVLSSNPSTITDKIKSGATLRIKT